VLIVGGMASRSGDIYLAALAGLLAGYAFLGKGFAYLGFPPLYIGDLVFLLGVVVFLRTHCLLGVFAIQPAFFLALMMGWALLRTLPFVGDYGFDALRDSVVIMYGSFAFIVTALLLQDCRRINALIQYYNAFVSVYVPVIPLLFAISWYMAAYLPTVFDSDVPILKLEPGEIAAHLTGAVVFVMAGFRKAHRLWLVSLLVGMVMVGSLSRGPMLAELVPITFAVLMLGKWRQLALTLSAGMMLFWTAYTVEPLFLEYAPARASEERSISTRQVLDNIASIFGQGGDQTEGTKEWRLDWWNTIIANTVYGPYFWTGRGFGLNIAMADGFSNWTARSGHAPLRSPHNVFMTLLARSGVPGIVLWLTVLVSWFATVLGAMQAARRRDQSEWAGLFLLLSCYVASILINASFDPALEGPMQGIWFWCLFGAGLGSVMVYRRQRVVALKLVANNTKEQAARVTNC
jgi:hypothetical protein